MIIIDNSYKKLDDKLRGRKPKVKLEKDGIKYIFKWGAINYEIWSELISEQIGKQFDVTKSAINNINLRKNWRHLSQEFESNIRKEYRKLLEKRVKVK